MDKEMLVEILKQGNTSVYSWALYFFKIDRRKQNPYTAYKIRFNINVNIKMYIFDHLRMYIFAIPPLDRYIFSIDKIFQ